MRVLVGAADTKSGADALALAAMLHRSLGDPLPELVRVYEATDRASPLHRTPSGRLSGKQWDDWAQAHANAVAEAARQRMARDHALPDCPITVLPASSTAAGLMDSLDGVEEGLVVIGSAPSGALGRFEIGSIANQLLHGCNHPVALAPNGLRLNHAPQVQRLVVAFASGSEGGAILRRGVDFARRMRVPLDVMTLLVRHRVFGSALGADAEAEVLQQSREDLLEAQQRTLQGLDHADLTVRQHVVVGDSVDSALHQMTWDVGDLLLVPSSRGTVQRVLLGDVNYRIVRATPVATLVLPRQTG